MRKFALIAKELPFRMMNTFWARQWWGLQDLWMYLILRCIFYSFFFFNFGLLLAHTCHYLGLNPCSVLRNHCWQDSEDLIFSQGLNCVGLTVCKANTFLTISLAPELYILKQWGFCISIFPQ